MTPPRRLRRRLTLLYSAASVASGIILLLMVAVLARSVQGDVRLAAPCPFVGSGAPTVVPVAPDQTANLLLVPALALVLLIPISLGLGWLFTGRILRPVRTMNDALQKISGRNVHERLALTGPRDEFTDLANTIDGLLGRLETALDGHKRFVANAAHELRTPLTLEQALLEEPLIDADADVDTYRANFERLLAASRQRTSLLESLLTLAGSEYGRDRTELVDLAAIVGDELPRHPGEPTIRAALRPARIFGDPLLIARLVANLCDNAVHHNIDGGEVEVSTRTDAGFALLVMANSGVSIPADQVDRLFEPFQRLRRVADDGHHGLGLSIVRAIAVAHGGQVAAYARPGGGLVVEVAVPAA